MQRMFETRSTDWSVGVKLPHYVKNQGCVDMRAVTGISAMMEQSAHQLREAYLVTGEVTEADLEEYFRLT